MTADVGTLMDEALQLAQALDAARLAPWLRIATAHNLHLEDAQQTLTLTRAALRVRVDFAAEQTTITMAIPDLPAGLLITAGSTPSAIRLGDPVLDGMISAHGDNEDAIRSLLRDDDMRGELLAVLHAWPDSTITASGIRLVLPTTTGADFDARLDEITALSARIAAHSEAVKTDQRRAIIPQPTN